MPRSSSSSSSGKGKGKGKKGHKHGKGLDMAGAYGFRPKWNLKDQPQKWYGGRGRKYYEDYKGKNRFGYDKEKFDNLQKQLKQAQQKIKALQEQKKKGDLKEGELIALKENKRMANELAQLFEKEKDKVKADDAYEQLKKKGRLEQFKKLVDQFKGQQKVLPKQQIAIVVNKSENQAAAKAALKQIVKGLLE